MQLCASLPCLHLAQSTGMLCKQHAAKYVWRETQCAHPEACLLCHWLKLKKDVNDPPFFMHLCIAFLPPFQLVQTSVRMLAVHVNARGFLHICCASWLNDTQAPLSLSLCVCFNFHVRKTGQFPAQFVCVCVCEQLFISIMCPKGFDRACFTLDVLCFAKEVMCSSMVQLSSLLTLKYSCGLWYLIV